MSAFAGLLRPYDWIFLALFVVALLTCVWTNLRFSCAPVKGRGDLDTYVQRCTTWLRANIIWYTIYYWAVAAGLLPSFIVLYITATEPVLAPSLIHRIIVYSVLGILITIVNLALNPLKTAYGYRTAYQQLDRALIRMRAGEPGAERLLQAALDNGEAYITNALYLVYPLGEEREPTPPSCPRCPKQLRRRAPR